MIIIRRTTYVTNNTGSTQDFVRKRLAPGETFEVIERDIQNWRDEPTISGAIVSGDLVVSNGEQTFNAAADGLYWFYGLPHQPLSVIRTSGGQDITADNSGAITVSGVGLIAASNDGGDVITISTAAASQTDLATVSGTLTENLQTLSGVVTDTFNYVLVEVVPNIETPATTVQQGFTEQDNTLSTSNSTSFQDKLTLTADTVQVVSGTTPWRLQWYYEWGYSGANAEFEGRIYLDGFDDLATIKWRPTATSSDDFNAHSGYEDLQLTEGVHDFVIQFRSTSGNKTARVRRARLQLVPLTLSTVSAAPPIRGNP